MSRTGKVLLGIAVAVAAAAIVAVLVVGPNQTVEMAQTLGEDQVREVDDSLTPIRGTTRVLLLCLDGVGHDVLRDVLRAERMPHLAQVMGQPDDDAQGLYERAYSVPKMLSILPSTTVASWASVFTGVGVAAHGVAGNEQFNREDRRFLAPAPVTVGDVSHMMEAFNGGLVGEMIKAQTLYERVSELRSHASLAHVHRGADVFTIPSGLDAAAIFGALITGATEEGEASSRLEGAQALDEQSVDPLLAAIDEHGLPDLQVVYFPGVDLYTHVVDHPIESQKRYLSEVLDKSIGRILDRYRSEGALDDTYVVVTADHGHTEVIDDDHHSLAAEGPHEPPTVLEALGFTMRPLELGVAEGPWSAALAYQGAFAYIHLADRSRCDEEMCDWSRPPRLEQDVLPVARAFFAANASGEGVAELQGALDLVFAREARPTTEDALPFSVFDGEGLVPIADYLRANPRPELLRLEQRLDALAAGPYGHRSGDVLLLARSGNDVPLDERYYFSGPYHSWHGSPRESDSHVPLVVAHHGQTAGELRAKVLRALGEARGGWHSHLGVVDLIESLLRADAR